MFKNVTSGGQTAMHKMRMWTQIMKKILLMFLIAVIGFNILWLFAKTSHYDRYVVLKISQAKMMLWYQNTVNFYKPVSQIDSKAQMKFTDYYGHSGMIYIESFLENSDTQNILVSIKSDAIDGILWSLLFGLLSALLLAYLFNRVGTKTKEDTIVRGVHLSDPKELKKLIKKQGQPSKYKIGGVPYPRNAVNRGTMVVGSTGGGKTVLSQDILWQVRGFKDRAIVNDIDGEYVSTFYRPGIDHILNPLDIRSPFWDMWEDCKHPAHLKSFVSSLMPLGDDKSNPFWIRGAHGVFTAVASKLAAAGEHSYHKLLQHLLIDELGDLQEYISDTTAKIYASEHADKAADGIRMVLATYIECFQYLKERQGDEKSFSIRDWVLDDKKDSWLFITSREDLHETLRPIITSWLDMAANAFLSLPKSDERILWFMLDEIATLQNLPSLPKLISRGRKRGSCIVPIIQSFPQFEKNFGRADAKIISSGCNSRVYFGEPDPDIARSIANALGEQEVNEIRESTSIAANNNRDGISYSSYDTNRQIVTASEIMSLPELTAYLKFPGALPRAKIKFKYKKYPEVEPSLELREINIDSGIQDAINKAQSVPLSDSDEEEKEIVVPKAQKKAKKKRKVKKLESEHDDGLPI